jgi:hypothetical protein
MICQSVLQQLISMQQFRSWTFNVLDRSTFQNTWTCLIICFQLRFGAQHSARTSCFSPTPSSATPEMESGDIQRSRKQVFAQSSPTKSSSFNASPLHPNLRPLLWASKSSVLMWYVYFLLL